MENIYIKILLIIILVGIGIISFHVYKLYLRISKIHNLLSIDKSKFEKLDFINTKEKVSEIHKVMMMIKFANFLDEVITQNEEE